MDVDELYAMAGVKPDDIDFVQTYDDYPGHFDDAVRGSRVLPQGRGTDFVRQHDLDDRRQVPAQHLRRRSCVGQAGAGGAYLGVVEAMRQVLGQAGPTQAGWRCARRVGVGLRNDQL